MRVRPVRLNMRLLRLLAAVVTSFATALAQATDAGRPSPFVVFNPFASFESRCADLPPPRIEVSAAPVEFAEDYGTSFRALSRMQEPTQGRHRTVGLTQARLGYESTLESHGLQDRGGRVCARPNITLVFTATPMTVYVAREVADDDCRRKAIREHEMKHVAVYQEYLPLLVGRARQQLNTLYGSEVVYGSDAKASQQAMRARLQTFMQPLMQAAYAELRARHAAVDTPEEYLRLERACGPLPQG